MKGRMFPFGIEMGVQTDLRHHMVSQGVQYEKTVANMDSSLSIQVDYPERKEFTNLFADDLQDSHQVLVSNLSFDVEMSDANRTKLSNKKKIKVYNKNTQNESEIL